MSAKGYPHQQEGEVGARTDMRSFRFESWWPPRLNVFSGGSSVQCCAFRNGGAALEPLDSGGRPALDALAGHHGHPRATPPS